MEENFSSESNSESATSDEMLSHVSTEDERITKRKGFGSSFKSEAESNTESSSHVSTLGQSSPDSIHFHIDVEHPHCKTGNNPQLLMKENVKSIILKMVNSSRSTDIAEAYNDINRNKYARMEESSGQIQLHVICNSVSHPLSDQILMWLIGLRNLICHGLPTVPRSHVTKLVFDPKLRNLILVNQNNVVGGICFRMFPSQSFTEVVFLAVSPTEQGKGYGTHMMNNLKDYHIKHKIYHLLTFAAVEALGFFEKQGFSNHITLPVSVYQGYINIYVHATLVECQLDKRITYTKYSEIVIWQKMIVKRLIEYQKSCRQSYERDYRDYETSFKKFKRV